MLRAVMGRGVRIPGVMLATGLTALLAVGAGCGGGGQKVLNTPTTASATTAATTTTTSTVPPTTSAPATTAVPTTAAPTTVKVTPTTARPVVTYATYAPPATRAYNYVPTTSSGYPTCAPPC
ncbi:MAG TPA: hypothetical protein VFH58_16280 [Acidimicrobiales bacterium]|nr:hypothetical protein [Acidimicrobiales bacterium]